MRGEQDVAAAAVVVVVVLAVAAAADAAVGLVVVVAGIVVEVVDIAYSTEVANAHMLADSFQFVRKDSAHPACC